MKNTLWIREKNDNDEGNIVERGKNHNVNLEVMMRLYTPQGF